MTDTPQITAALVTSLIATQFPQWSDRPIKPVRTSGWDNRTFHLGPDMLVRLPSAARYAPQPQKEWNLLPRLTGQLPVATPPLLGQGKPQGDYPYHWSILGWLDGDMIHAHKAKDDDALAQDLATALRALYRISTDNVPAAGQHNFYRGGDLRIYDQEIRHSLRQLPALDHAAILKCWDKACTSQWSKPPVWVHGDVAVGNMLMKDGRLNALIDFGSAATGDPACDLTIAWTLFDHNSRAAFKTAMDMDASTWARARGWGLWKACLEHTKGTPEAALHIARILSD